MAITYYMQIHIESAGTRYIGDGTIPKSMAGHMWYEVYQKDANGNIIPESQQSSGYTSDGIVNDDKENYLYEPSYSSQEQLLTQEQYDIYEEIL